MTCKPISAYECSISLLPWCRNNLCHHWSRPVTKALFKSNVSSAESEHLVNIKILIMIKQSPLICETLCKEYIFLCWPQCVNNKYHPSPICHDYCCLTFGGCQWSYINKENPAISKREYHQSKGVGMVVTRNIPGYYKNLRCGGSTWYLMACENDKNKWWALVN